MTDALKSYSLENLMLKAADYAAENQPPYRPSNCPHCEYDRRFPGFESGGWMQQENNGPIVSCPMCNPNGEHPRE